LSERIDTEDAAEQTVIIIPHGTSVRRPWGSLHGLCFMNAGVQRVVGFVDGFNLYHAIKDLSQPHLKWLDIRSLLSSYAAQANQQVVEVYYFSAYATWLTSQYARHRAYVVALSATGVTPVLGNFKAKDRHCSHCRHKWVAHEEKETDVNVALYLLNLAYKDAFDLALVVSNDSDLAPAVRMVRAEFPAKRVRILTPPSRFSSKDFANAAGGLGNVRSIKASRIAKHLLPASITDASGAMISRPTEYNPP
jgi:uncharacterized LabA/DUF88 family protein